MHVCLSFVDNYDLEKAIQLHELAHLLFRRFRKIARIILQKPLLVLVRKMYRRILHTKYCHKSNQSNKLTGYLLRFATPENFKKITKTYSSVAARYKATNTAEIKPNIVKMFGLVPGAQPQDILGRTENQGVKVNNRK